MSTAFDPYYKWLGIPLEEQPPDHYRLLGVRRYEADADVIESAADARMHFLRSLQGGKHGPLTQRLLNEVAAARLCLLDSQQRSTYDGLLRARPLQVADRHDASRGVRPVTAVSPPQATAATPSVRPSPSAPPSSSVRPVKATPIIAPAALPAPPPPIAEPSAGEAEPLLRPSPPLRRRQRRRRKSRWRDLVTWLIVAILLLAVLGVVVALRAV